MTGSENEVSMIDLTCRSLPYDVHLVEGLRNAGANVTLWVAGCLPGQRRGNCGRSLLDVASSVPGSKARKIAKAAEYLINGVGLHQSLRRDSPDIVHYQWLPFIEKMWPLELLNLKLSKNRGAGIVYTVHNVLPHDTQRRYRNAFRRIYKIPDAIICHTRESKDQLVDDFEVPSGRIWVIPHGPLSNEVTFAPQEEAKNCLQIDSETPICLLFGFIRPYKGIEFLIDSWKYIKKRAPSARLVLAGQPESGYGEILINKIEALDLQREIDTRFKFLPQGQLNLLIQAADILVYPYREITQSGALLTGLTTGKPIVATNVGGFGEIIQHGRTGILVEYGDEEGMAEELAQLLRNPEKRKQLGRAAQEMVDTEYSWDAIALKTLECYQSVKKYSQ